MQISLENITKRYRDAEQELTVIDGLTHRFPERGTVGILGRSGVGKSTLMHILGGLDMPTSGSILFDGTALEKLSGDQRAAFRAQHIGFVFQFHHLLPEFNAMENVAMPLIISGVSHSAARDKAEALLERLGLKERMRHLPGQLSGGEQQRVAIGRALINSPKVMLADEPTGNLDIRTARDVQELLLEMNRELGNVLIIVTHSQELAAELDQALEMGPGGKLTGIGRPS